MFLATAAATGTGTIPPEFVSAHFTGTLTDGADINVVPSTVMPSLQSGDFLVACITNSDSYVPYYPYAPVSTSGGPTWSTQAGTTLFSNDSNDSATQVFFTVHNGSNYTVNFGNTRNDAATIVQLLAFRDVTSMTTLNSGVAYNSSYVNFPNVPVSNGANSIILQLGGGGQYGAHLLGTYPDPGVYDYFDSYMLGTTYYPSGTVGYGIYTPYHSFTTNIPAVTWSGAAYNSSRSSRFYITLKLDK